MKRFVQIIVAIIVVLLISNLLSRGASSANLPADVRRTASSPHSESVSTPKYARESSASEEGDPNSAQEPENADSRFERARIRYRNVAQQLLTSLADWEMRLQETLQKLEKFQAEWESSAGLGKKKEIGEPGLGNRTSQEDAVINEKSPSTPKTSVNDGSSQLDTVEVGSGKTSDISHSPIAFENLDLQEPDKSKQAEDLARQCEQLGQRLLELAKQIRANNSTQE